MTYYLQTIIFDKVRIGQRFYMGEWMVRTTEYTCLTQQGGTVTLRPDQLGDEVQILMTDAQPGSTMYRWAEFYLVLPERERLVVDNYLATVNLGTLRMACVVFTIALFLGMGNAALIAWLW